MKLKKSILVIRQLDKKLSAVAAVNIPTPAGGWVYMVRTTLKMSLRQLGAKMGITPQSVKELEQREKEGMVTLNTLKEAAHALDMKLVYAFIPADGSLEKMIERKAYTMAHEIVSRTSMSMKLEDQENTAERIKLATDELAQEIKREIPKKLWD